MLLSRSEVVDKVHGFYCTGFNPDGLTYDEARYQKDVLTHVATLEEMHRHRQEIARELPKPLVDRDFEVNADILIRAIECVRKLGVFWGTIEAATDLDLAGEDIDFESIKSGAFLLMEYLGQIAGLDSDGN